MNAPRPRLAPPPAVTAFLLVVLTFAAYLPVFEAQFVTFDDNVYITDNPNVKSGFTRESIAWALS